MRIMILVIIKLMPSPIPPWPPWPHFLTFMRSVWWLLLLENADVSILPPGLRQKTNWFHDWYFHQEGCCGQKKPLEEPDWKEGVYKSYLPSVKGQHFFKRSRHNFLLCGCCCGKNLSQPKSGPVWLSWLGLPLITWCHHQLFHVHSSFLVSGEKFSNLLNLTNHTC